MTTHTAVRLAFRAIIVGGILTVALKLVCTGSPWGIVLGFSFLYMGLLFSTAADYVDSRRFSHPSIRETF